MIMIMDFSMRLAYPHARPMTLTPARFSCSLRTSGQPHGAVANFQWSRKHPQLDITGGWDICRGHYLGRHYPIGMYGRDCRLLP